MKALVMKDIYILKSNLRTVMIMWLLMCFLVNTSSVESYLMMVAVMIGVTFIVTTFSYDDHSHWNRYAVIMPVKKQEIVQAKYVTMFCFALFGLVFGTFAALLGGILTDSFSFNGESVVSLLLFLPASFFLTTVIGSTAIWFVYKFGVEQARLTMVAAAVIPTLILAAVYWIADALLGVEFTEAMYITLICVSPLFALAYAYLTCKLSIRIFETQEF